MDWKKEVLGEIKPTLKEEKEAKQRIECFLKMLNNSLKDAKAILGGSGAKGTWLKGQHDTDIFAVFPESYRDRSDKISDMLEKQLPFKNYNRLHGSRDYFQIMEDDVIYEIIPVIKIKKANEALNITDCSPLHAEWVRKNSNEKLRDEIRLAKAFCKAQKCYGAESYIQGFSGYVLEILVIHYGSFEKLLKAAVKWKEKEVIDTAKFYKKKDEVFMAINKSKLNSPIIVVDPIDKYRNAAAALSMEKWKLFNEKAKKFLKKPNTEFFERKYADFNKLKKKGNLLWMEVEPIVGKEDKSGAQLMLAFEFLRKGFEKFGIADSGWEWDKKKNSVFWFLVQRKELDKVEIRKGPPAEMKEHATRFKKEHKKTFEKKGYVFAEINVENYRIKDFVDELIRKEYFKRKIRKIKEIKIH